MAYRREAANLMAKIKGDRRRVSENSDSSMSSSKNDPPSPNRSMAPSPPSMERPSSPVKRRLCAKDNDSDPDPDPDPPSYAATVARSFITVENDCVNGTVHPPVNAKRAARPTIQPLVAMPTIVPASASPRSADRIRSPNPAFLAPPKVGSGHFANHLRSESVQEDLNRLVSVGSTLTNGTTLTIGSAESGVKHAGPLQMVHIKPGDLPTIPERVGGMFFDRELGRWIKERGASRMTIARSSVHPSPQGSPANTEGTSESEDPFRDIESTRDGDSTSRSVAAHDVSGYTLGDLDPNGDRSAGSEDMDLVNSDPPSVIEHPSMLDGEGKSYASSFSIDQPSVSVDVVDFLPGEDQSNEVQDDLTTDSDDDDLRDTARATVDEEEEFIENFASMSMYQLHIQNGAELSISMSMDASAAWQEESPAPAVATPRPTSKKVVQPPRSALKSASVTPISKPGQGRSVSFSDGRLDGKIKGLNSESEDSTIKGLPVTASSVTIQSAPSVRTKRILDMLGDLESSGKFSSIVLQLPLNFFLVVEGDEDQDFFTQGSSRPAAKLAPVVSSDDSITSSASQRPFKRSQTIRLPGQSSPRRVNTPSRANATFLTECSFGVAHDRLVQVITDIQPFEPHWDRLTSVDLSNQKLDSVVRLKEFLPNLEILNL